jgi:SUN domain-containing protein 1/2
MKRPAGQGSDEEARAKLQAFEERMSTVEGGVKEAIELGQSALKAGSAAAAITAPSWWNKLSSGTGSAVTIKSSDGQDVTAVVAHMFEKTLALRAKDGIARVDYALHSGGGAVIPSLTSPTYELRQTHLFGLISSATSVGNSPVHALHHELTPGYCWPFPGSEGQLGIRLAAPVYITDITIDHAPKEIAHDVRSAPRRVEVWGLVEGQDNIEKLKGYMVRKDQLRREAAERGEPLSDDIDPPYPSTLPRNVPFVRIASFEYDIRAENYLQTFPVFKDIQELGVDFGIVVVMVKSNWGHDTYTCLYRVRVHGERLEALPEPDPPASSS